MRYWWVNHKQTFCQEFAGKYVWCPKRKTDGRLSHFYETVREVQPGDVVFSYANAQLQGFGYVKTCGYSCPRPDEFGRLGEVWDVRGWRADVDFQSSVWNFSFHLTTHPISSYNTLNRQQFEPGLFWGISRGFWSDLEQMRPGLFAHSSTPPSAWMSRFPILCRSFSHR